MRAGKWEWERPYTSPNHRCFKEDRREHLLQHQVFFLTDAELGQRQSYSSILIAVIREETMWAFSLKPLHTTHTHNSGNRGGRVHVRTCQ